MKLIKPTEISARILTLLDESDERVIIVSPYMKISKWYKFILSWPGSVSTGISKNPSPARQALYEWKMRHRDFHESASELWHPFPGNGICHGNLGRIQWIAGFREMRCISAPDAVTTAFRSTGAAWGSAPVWEAHIEKHFHLRAPGMWSGLPDGICSEVYRCYRRPGI